MTDDLWLMPDYGGTMLWHPGHDVDYAIDHHEFGLPAALIRRLDAWAATYAATLHPEDPSLSGFRSETARHAFLREGRSLRDALAMVRPDLRVALKLPDHI